MDRCERAQPSAGSARGRERTEYCERAQPSAGSARGRERTEYYDYALVGGGLAAGLIALAVRAARPAARICVIERGRTLGGNHTWCFHAGDVDDAPWLEPLVVARWPEYDVRFAGLERRLASAYAAVTSARFDACVRPAVDTLWLETAALAIEANGVVTTRGTVLADRVIDARGPDRLSAHRCGWQIFVGQEVIAPGHGLVRPIVFDATVAQRGAFRFMYVLPLDADRLLIEDTAFADAPYLDVAAGRETIAAYARSRGWTIESIVREETGILPLPLELDIAPPDAPLVAGYAGGWFHPVTGYSFPVAVRLARAIANDDSLDGLWDTHRAQVGFALRLNRMLFGWFPPEQRHHVLARFYRLPEPTIRRFYALETTALDRARFFVGRPPRGLSWRAMLGGAA